MYRRAPVCAAALLVALVGCARPQRSPDYERARATWTELVQARPGDAAEDPRAEEVLRLLAAVPRDSLDAEAAAELRGRIEAERTVAAQARARREALVAGAGTATSAPAAFGAAATPTEAASAEPGRLAPGTTLADFRATHAGCFDRHGPAQVTVPDGGAARAGEVWLMKEDGACRERFPALVGQAVLFAGDAVAGVVPVERVLRAPVRQEVRPVEIRRTEERTVELAELPDGGMGMVVDGGVVPLPAGATVHPVDGGAAQ